MTTAAALRRVNLIECLKDDAAAAGGPVDDPPPGSEAWPDAAIKAYYRAAPWPPPPPAAWGAWFPAAARQPPRTTPPFFLVVAFPCAGSAEDMFSSEGSGPRRAPSPLLAWLAAAGGQLLAVQLPGRAARRGEPPPSSAAAVAAALLPLIAPLIAGGPDRGAPPVPWAIVGHSLGAWLAFELATAAAAARLPPPVRLLVSAMPAPCWPEGGRPWRRQAVLDGGALKAECRAWGISDAVFEPTVWADYEGLLRADFRLFDEYAWRAPPPLSCPITAFYGDADTRVTAAMVAAWQGVTTAPARVACAGGPHLWPLQRAPKAAWLAEVVAELARDVGGR